MNFSGYVGHVTKFWLNAHYIACCLVVGLRLELELGLSLVSLKRRI